MSNLTIVIEGGIVQQVTMDGKPVPADVYDYDTDGMDPAELETDENGAPRYVYSP